MGTPNVVFIFSDEQRADTLRSYGNDRIEMPHLNRLASESTVFERAYCTQPVCTPSRGSIMSGAWPHRHGALTNNVPLPEEVSTLVERLPAGRYRTGYVGKWHLGDEIFRQHGFDEWVSIEDEYTRWYRPGRDRTERSSYYHFLTRRGVLPGEGNMYSRAVCARLPEELGKPAFVAAEAIDFISRHAGAPFVLFVNFLEPHMPFFGPRDGQYDPATIPLPDNFNAPRATRWQEAIARDTYEHGSSGLPLRHEDDWRRMIANYWGLNSLVDTHVGAIIDRLRALDLYDDTIIVYTSDHGDMMGSHRMIAKGTMYEESVRVPLLVRLPGQYAARHIPQPVSHIDLAPTLMDLLGVDGAGGDRRWDGSPAGVSLVPQLTGAAPPDRDVLIEWHEPEEAFVTAKLYGDESGRRGRSVRPYLRDLGPAEGMERVFRAARRALVTSDGRHKLILSQDGEHCLFDLRNDPYEETNRYDAAAPSTRDCTERLLALMETYGDPLLESIAMSAGRAP